MAVKPVVEINGYVKGNGFGPREHPGGLLDRIVIPDPDFRPQGRGADRDVAPIPGDEHKRREHQRIFFLSGGENAHGEGGREELEREAVDRGGTLGSDGLVESGFDFFAFSTEVCHFRFEEVESLPEVGDGEVGHRVWISRIWVVRDKLMWAMKKKREEIGARDRPLPQLYTCTESKENGCSVVTDFGGAGSAEK